MSSALFQISSRERGGMGGCGQEERGDETEGGKSGGREIAVIYEIGRGWICGKGKRLNQRKYTRSGSGRTGF